MTPDEEYDRLADRHHYLYVSTSGESYVAADKVPDEDQAVICIDEPFLNDFFGKSMANAVRAPSARQR